MVILRGYVSLQEGRDNVVTKGRLYCIRTYVSCFIITDVIRADIERACEDKD